VCFEVSVVVSTCVNLFPIAPRVEGGDEKRNSSHSLHLKAKETVFLAVSSPPKSPLFCLPAQLAASPLNFWKLHFSRETERELSSLPRGFFMATLSSPCHSSS